MKLDTVASNKLINVCSAIHPFAMPHTPWLLLLPRSTFSWEAQVKLKLNSWEARLVRFKKKLIKDDKEKSPQSTQQEVITDQGF